MKHSIWCLCCLYMLGAFNQFCVAFLVLRWVGHAALMGEMRNMYKMLVGKQEWNRQLVRARRR